MASLNGVEIKSLKLFRGHEGEGVYQGTVYYNNRKLGFWSQSSVGGCDTYDFDNSALDTPFYMWKSQIKGSRYYEYADLDIFMMVLAGIISLEKTYKNNLKKGLSFLAYSINLTDGMWSCIGCSTKEMAQKKWQQTLYKVAYQGDKEDFDFIKHQVISTLEELNIIIGSKEDAQKEKLEIEKARQKRLEEFERKEAERKEQERQKLKNNRFIVKDGNGPYKIIEDKTTGKTTKVSLNSYQEVMSSLIDLFF